MDASGDLSEKDSARAAIPAEKVGADPDLSESLPPTTISNAVADVLDDPDEVPPDPEWLEPTVRYDHGRLEVRDPGDTIWREKVYDGQHVE